jgi:SNF2 family DNA or RNA helicase
MEIFLLRRKKDTMLDGKRLIELPDRNVELVRLTFSDEEREIYKMVRSVAIAIFAYLSSHHNSPGGKQVASYFQPLLESRNRSEVGVG